MEFKLNKIDTDIRKKIQEDRRESKVHSGKSINVNKDLSDDKPGNSADVKTKDKKTQKRFITIDGVKYFKDRIRVEAEKTTETDILNSKGQILDTKK